MNLLKDKKFLFSVIVGLFFSAFLFGLTVAAFKQRNRIISIAKLRINALMKPKIKVLPNSLLDEIDQVQGIIKININPKKELNTVNNLIYGSNLVPYSESEPDIINFAKEMGLSCFRFPGGESPGYHWKTGKYDFDQRSANCALSKIDYLIEFCKKTSTKLIIQVNVESGTAEEAAEWVEYMNKKVGFPVKYWELGNEVFGDWDKGFMSAGKYAKLIKEYAIAMKNIDPDIKIGMDWAPFENNSFNVEVMKKAGQYIDFVSYHWYPNHINASHRYEGRIHPTPKEVMANPLQITKIVENIHAIIVKNAKEKIGKIEIAFLEWDCGWDAPNSDMPPFSQGIVQWSLANAIFHADCYGQFVLNNVSVSTQYLFQDINFGLIRGWDKEGGWGGQRWDGETIRPKAYAIKLFSQHFGDIVLESIVDNSPYYFKKADWWPDSYAGKVPYISCYASRFSRKNTLSIVFINKHAKNDYKVEITIPDLILREKGRLFVLNGPNLLAENEGNPLNVKIKNFEVNNINNEFFYTIPAHSVNVLEIDYEE